MKVGILSLGCAKNLVDSQIILGEFAKKGYKIVDEVARADVAIVNTCAFIDEAKRESIDAILDVVRLKQEGRIKKIIVAGCLPQRYGEILHKRLKEVDELRGVIDFTRQDKKARILITPPHYTYLKISEGCDNICNYCIVSKIRGRYKSRSIKSIEEEFIRFKRHLSEVNLISQDTTYFGNDLYGRPSLDRLLMALIKNSRRNDRCRWIRLLYCHPAHLTDSVIDIIKDTAVLCEYIDLPIQHINNRILKRMNRRVTKKQIIRLIKKARKKIPQLFIRSTLIVGFPGETDEQFNELLGFIKEIKFERLGVFTYSREEGTPAFSYRDQVPEKVKTDRFKELMQVQQKISEEVNSRLLGKTLNVLIDEKDAKDPQSYIARTQWDAPEVDGQVFVKSRKRFSPGDFVNVKITDTLEYDLVGETENAPI